MGKKIFVSYKYSDNNVKNIKDTHSFFYDCTVRDYVNVIDEKISTDSENHIFKGEPDGEDLSQLSKETIWEKLKNRIYDSTLTIVMLSKGMKEQYKEEKHQWIPQELSYSLKETSRKNKSGNTVQSKTNALLAVVLPDREGSYSYFLTDNVCCSTPCRTLNSNSPHIFSIMRGNLFNRKKQDSYKCNDGRKIYRGESSYMLCVKWDDFINDMDSYINRAYQIRDNIDEYDIQKEI